MHSLRFPSRAPRSAERGFTLLEMALVLGVSMTVLVATMGGKFEDLRDTQAKELGVRVAQYTQALGHYMSERGLATPPGTFAGTAWLKDGATCPGGAGTAPYLPCNFPDVFPYGMTVATTVAPGVDTVVATTVVGPNPLAVSGRRRGDLAGLAVTTARTTAPSTQRAAGAALAEMIEYEVNALGQIESRVDMAAAADPWLRLDGSNAMQANLDMDGNDLVASRRVEWTDSALTEDGGGSIALGGAGASYIDFQGTGARIDNPGDGSMQVAAPGGLLAAADMEVTGAHLVGGDAEVVGGHLVGGDALVTGTQAVGGDALVGGVVQSADVVMAGPGPGGGYSYLTSLSSVRDDTVDQWYEILALQNQLADALSRLAAAEAAANASSNDASTAWEGARAVAQCLASGTGCAHPVFSGAY